MAAHKRADSSRNPDLEMVQLGIFIERRSKRMLNTLVDLEMKLYGLRARPQRKIVSDAILEYCEKQLKQIQKMNPDMKIEQYIHDNLPHRTRTR